MGALSHNKLYEGSSLTKTYKNCVVSGWLVQSWTFSAVWLLLPYFLYPPFASTCRHVAYNLWQGNTQLDLHLLLSNLWADFGTSGTLTTDSFPSFAQPKWCKSCAFRVCFINPDKLQIASAYCPTTMELKAGLDIVSVAGTRAKIFWILLVDLLAKTGLNETKITWMNSCVTWYILLLSKTALKTLSDWHQWKFLTCL